MLIVFFFSSTKTTTTNTVKKETFQNFVLTKKLTTLQQQKATVQFSAKKSGTEQVENILQKFVHSQICPAIVVIINIFRKKCQEQKQKKKKR